MGEGGGPLCTLTRIDPSYVYDKTEDEMKT